MLKKGASKDLTLKTASWKRQYFGSTIKDEKDFKKHKTSYSTLEDMDRKSQVLSFPLSLLGVRVNHCVS